MNKEFDEKIVLERIKPKPEEYKLVFSVYEEVRQVLVEYLEKEDVNVAVTLQGSVAKDTWLSGEVDLDVFVLFPENTTKEWIKDKGIQLLEKALEKYSPVKAYAEHPYLRISSRGVNIDVVPAIMHNKPENARTAVDRTPFHTQYINSKLTNQLRDEVRIFKQFLRAMNIYGAEIKVRGFSGYLAELLIIYFGSFKEVLKVAARWRPPVVIDIENHYAGSFKEVLKRFHGQPLIVIDPVDPRRNVAASVSTHSLATLSIAAKLYLEKSSIHYFYPPGITEYCDADRLDKVAVIRYEHENIVDDVLWGELRRLTSRIKQKLEELEFKVRYAKPYRVSDNSSIILVEVEMPVLDNYKIITGPPWYLHENSIKFVQKHVKDPAGPYIGDDGRIYSLKLRQYIDVCSALKRVVKLYGDTSHLHSDSAEIACGEQVASMVDKECLMDFICRKPAWLRAYMATISSEK